MTKTLTSARQSAYLGGNLLLLSNDAASMADPLRFVMLQNKELRFDRD